MSDNIEVQTPKQNAKAKAGYALQERQKVNSRTVNEGEPIAYAEKTTMDRALGSINNPGRVPVGKKINSTKSGAEVRGMKDPTPQKLSKSKPLYDGVPEIEKDKPFFKHTIKDKI